MKKHFAAALAISLGTTLASVSLFAAEFPFAWTNDTAAKVAATSEKLAVMANRDITNPKRAYPPSCLKLPLPTNPSGPGLTGTVGLLSALDGTTHQVNLTIWRVPCSESKAALLVTIAGSPLDFLQLPSFVGAQDDGDGIQEDEDAIYFRLVSEPNTLVQGETRFVIPDSGLVTFVLEVAEATARTPNLNDVFGIGAQYLFGSVVVPATIVDPYDSSDYPPIGDMPLSGYLSGSYFDPEHSGEGMVLEVVEVGETLLALVSWYTFDAQGYAFWLIGAAPFTPGDTSVNMAMSSKFGGRIAGDFDSAGLTDLPWGNITVSFPDCNTLDFSFASTHNINGLPVGTGQRTWKRLTSINRFSCE
ncbi:MAG TPA: hypothetical protein P5307_22825 [Pirellulaceae bacterium]|nr:hypothetical protein [Pirellulaceae bacterium]